MTSNPNKINILQSHLFFIVQQKKEMDTGLDRRDTIFILGEL